MARSVHMPAIRDSPPPAGAAPLPVLQPMGGAGGGLQAAQENHVKIQRPFMDGDFEFVSGHPLVFFCGRTLSASGRAAAAVARSGCHQCPHLDSHDSLKRSGESTSKSSSISPFSLKISNTCKLWASSTGWVCPCGYRQKSMDDASLIVPSSLWPSSSLSSQPINRSAFLGFSSSPDRFFFPQPRRNTPTTAHPSTFPEDVREPFILILFFLPTIFTRPLKKRRKKEVGWAQLREMTDLPDRILHRCVPFFRGKATERDAEPAD